MQAELSTILQQLFQQSSLDQVSTETLREFTEKYPYAGIGQVLLAKKDREAGRKAVYYVEDPLWLEYVLEDSRQKTEDRSEEARGEKLEARREEIETEKEKEKEIEIEIEIKNEAAENSVSLGASVENEKKEIEKEKEVVAVTEKAEVLVFEPYHTIDYFASMGIKLSREDLDKDRFGRQLKSFTEWLKSMKKITPVAGSQPEGPDTQIEQKAAASVKPSEVDTEAMAEVWLKQGNKEKALAIYRKLSLQNPSKSHYFASLIDQINA